MQKNSILSTHFSSMYNLPALIKPAHVWLLDKSRLDMDQSEYSELINSINPLQKNPISDCFLTIKRNNSFSNIYFISSVLNKKLSVPEILTINDLSIYGKQINYIKDPDLKKSWINISGSINAPSRNRYGSITVASVNEIMNSVVRANLCMSYADRKEWTSASNAAFLIETYATMMRLVLDRAYRLDLEESVIFKYAFAYYYAYLINDTMEDGAPVLLKRCTTLFKHSSTSLGDLAGMMKDTLKGHPPTIPLIVEFIKKNGPPRVKSLSPEMLYRVLSVASSNSVSTWLAIDYPPYLAYLILLTVSGTKHPILSNVMNNMFSQTYVKKHVDELIKYNKTYIGEK